MMIIGLPFLFEGPSQPSGEYEYSESVVVKSNEHRNGIEEFESHEHTRDTNSWKGEVKLENW